MPDIRQKITELKQKAKEKGSREARSSGNPHADSDIDRHLSNEGEKRKAEDIPKQDKKDIRRNVVKGNVTSKYQSSTVETFGKYKFGNPVRPNIKHDSGFSIFSKEEPTFNDYKNLIKWMAMLEAAETLRPDLIDGVAAYSHFLNGEGKPRIFSYNRYVMNDESGRVTLRNAILEAQDAAMTLWKSNPHLTKFSFTGPPIPCGATSSKLSYVSTAFPYPATENWQKAIGAHTIWLSGNVEVKTSSHPGARPEFEMDLTIHAEDQYNFNPGMEDIASGIPDDENGRFVVVGFAKGYRNSSTIHRYFKWTGDAQGVSQMGHWYSRQELQPKPQVMR